MLKSEYLPPSQDHVQFFAKNIVPSAANPQEESAFFTVLPVEIRTQLYIHMLSEYDDLTKPYPRNSYYFRPDFQYAPQIDTALLKTCRRVYLETCLLPVSLATHCFWGGPDRGPPNHRGNKLARKGPRTAPTYFDTFFHKEQQAAITHVHYFLQQFFLEGEAGFRSICKSHPMQTVTDLKITIRHTD